MAVVLGGCAVSRGGFALNHLDVAPTYAGSVMSMANTAGTFAGIIGVHLTGPPSTPEQFTTRKPARVLLTAGAFKRRGSLGRLNGRLYIARLS